MPYKVHEFRINMSRDQMKLEQFLNGLTGEIVAVVPNVSLLIPWAHRVNFLLIVEKLR